MAPSKTIDAVTIPPSIAPNRILFAMLRVRDLETSVSFYREMLGMSELGRETFATSKFTVVYMGYGESTDSTALELTHNWENEGYEQGTAFGNLSLAVENLYALETFLVDQGVTILRPAGELAIRPDETGKQYTLAHIADPDGYRIELMQV